jgi:nucleotide-binding universal stress UspA family protein
MTTSFRKILVPVDFSSCSEAAYRAALTLAKPFKAELLLLHVIDMRIVDLARQAGAAKAGLSEKALHQTVRLKFRDFLAGHPDGVKYRRVIATGVPFHEIVKLARVERAELIVMGRYGGTGDLDKIFFGSTAEKVVRMAPCAVLTVPLLSGKTGGPVV